MILYDQFRKRASKLYDNQRTREKQRLLSSVPKGIRITLSPDEILPYSRQELIDWLMEKVGLGAILCRYCHIPIDALSCVLDHVIPLTLGGPATLDNQQPICSRCNTLKGEMMPDEFEELALFLMNATPHLRSYVEECLLLGPQGKRAKFFPYIKKGRRETAA
jgi:5-methylcytosine-specific restriction endonuclease McrA